MSGRGHKERELTMCFHYFEGTQVGQQKKKYRGESERVRGRGKRKGLSKALRCSWCQIQMGWETYTFVRRQTAISASWNEQIDCSFQATARNIWTRTLSKETSEAREGLLESLSLWGQGERTSQTELRVQKFIYWARPMKSQNALDAMPWQLRSQLWCQR